jgi:hypothetical protein
MIDINTTYEWLEIAGKGVYPKDSSLLNLAPILVLEELTETVEAIGSDATDGYIKALKDSIVRLESKVHPHKPDMRSLRDGIADLYVTVTNIAYGSGIAVWGIERDYDRVMDSNFTKFCYTEEEAEATVQAYRNGTHPNKLGECIETQWKLSDEPDAEGRGVYIITSLAGKILKSINYEEPKFKSIG